MRILSTCLITFVAGAFILAGGGCADTKLVAQRDGLAQQNKELASQLRAETDARQAAEIRAKAQDASLTPAISESPTTPDMGGPLVFHPDPKSSKSGTSAKSPTPVKVTTKVTLPGQVLFASGRTTLDAAATKTLDTMAATLKSKYKGEKLVLEGYTDSTPPSKTSVFKSNEEIAQARASAVKKYLVKKGIAEADISIKAMAPVTAKNAASSRRVDIVVMAGK